MASIRVQILELLGAHEAFFENINSNARTQVGRWLAGSGPALMPPMDLASLRKEYTLDQLRAENLDPDPIKQFQKWFRDAVTASEHEPNAMVLATTEKTAHPSARVLLLKGVDQRGFTFFTNYLSRKGRELDQNPRAAMVFYWAKTERQVCIAGAVSKLSREESEEYFKSRPRGNRLGAWASRQSEVIESREQLEEQMLRIEAQYPGEDIPMPSHWGGYLLAPERIEFWQGRPNRLHDRFCYTREGDRWKVQRLSP